MASVKTLTDDAGNTRAYKVRWWTSAGRPRSQTFPLGQKAKAEAFAIMVEANKLSGTELDWRGSQLTVAQYVEEWRAVLMVRKGTDLRVGRALILFLDMLGDRPVGKVRQSEIRGWLKARGQTVAASTLRTDWRWVRAVFAAAVADHLIPASPCDGIRLETLPRRRSATPDPQGVLAIASRLPATWAALAPLGARTGLRPAELLGLCVEQIDFLRMELRVDRQVLRGRVIAEPKTAASARTVPLDPDTVALISAHLAAHPLGPAVPVFDVHDVPVGEGRLIFHRPNGAPVSHEAANSTWKRAATAAGQPGVRMHDMRHFCASHLIRQGASAVLVAGVLGHSRPSITHDTYAHEFEDRDERVRDLTIAVWANHARSQRVLDGTDLLR